MHIKPAFPQIKQPSNARKYHIYLRPRVKGLHVFPCWIVTERLVAVQVQLYFPQFGHPAYGIVRAIAKDSSDYYEGLSSITFLDSDGRVKHIKAGISRGTVHIPCCNASMPPVQILHGKHLSL